MFAATAMALLLAASTGGSAAPASTLSKQPVAPAAQAATTAPAHHAKALEPGLHFPFGWKPTTTFDELAALHESCRDPKASGAVLCYLEPSDDLALDVLPFHPRSVSVGYVPRDGRRVLSEVTLYAENLRDCDDLLAAYSSAIEWAEANYGKPHRVLKGPHYRSTSCGDYLKEGSVQWVGEYPGWRVRVDAFYAKGAYTVYQSIVNLENEALHRAAQRKGEGPQASDAR
jgi:hypothetical protein